MMDSYILAPSLKYSYFKSDIDNEWLSIYGYYTIIDFNEADIRIYLPEKVIFTEAEVNITFFNMTFQVLCKIFTFTFVLEVYS